MIYALLTSPTGHRSLRKLPQDVQDHLFQQLQVLKTAPQTGEPLKSKFRFLRSFHTRYLNIEYRVVYEVVEKAGEIYIHYAASRENFYRELERLRLKARN